MSDSISIKRKQFKDFTMPSRLLQTFILIIALLGIGNLGATFSDSWVFSSSVSEYVELTGGTILGTAIQGAVGANSLDDVQYTLPSGTIPFPFEYNGSSYTGVQVSTNGQLIFGGNYGGYTLPLSSTTVANGIVAVLARDLQGLVLAGSLGQMRYDTVGTAPDREFVIQWKNFKKYGTANNDENYNFQVHLQETTGRIRIAFGSMTVNASNGNPQVGIRGASNADYFARTTTTDWSATNRATVNSATCTLTSGVFPASGLCMNFLPFTVEDLPNPAVLVSPDEGASDVPIVSNLTWASGGGAPSGYRLNLGTDNPPTNMAQNLDLGSALSYDPELEINTTYYWQVIPYNLYGSALACPIWSFSTQSELTALISVGTGTLLNTATSNNDPTPYGTYYRNFRQQYLYLASEIEIAGGGAGAIRSLAFNVGAVNTCSTMPQFAIRLKQTNVTTLTTTFDTGEYQQVYYNEEGFLPVAGWNTHVFSEPFIWDGASNIIVDILTSLIPGDYTQNASVYHSDTANNRALRYQHDTLSASAATTGSLSTKRANIVFNMATVVISNPPNPAMLVAPQNQSTQTTQVVTLSWNSGGGLPTGYRLYLGTTNPPPLLQDIGTNLSYSTSTLEYNTLYYWKIVPYNAHGDANNCPVWSFTTMPNPFVNSFPWTESFGSTGTTFPPTYWNRYSGFPGSTLVSSTQWAQDDWLNNPDLNNKAARINIYGTSVRGWLVTPGINIPAQELELKFDAAMMVYNSTVAPSTTQSDDRFVVFMSESPTMTDPVILREWNNTGSPYIYNDIPHTGTNITIPLTGISGLKYIAFYGESTVSNNGDNDFFVDNVTIGSVPTEPIFSVTPTAHSFGDVNLNASRSKTISVSNLGIGTLGINSISISGDDCFTLSEVPELPASVELGSPLSFNVLFAPQELGNFSATITIVDDLQRVAHSVSVTGSGVNVITVGTGLQNAQIPLDFNWKNSLFETLYYPSELDGFVGLITGIRFYNQFVTTTLTNKPTRIWLGTTALNDLSTEWIPSTELTLVFDGVLDYPAGQNTISIDFPEPFLYVDGQNLVMLAQRPMDTGYFSSSDYFKAQTVGTNRSRKVRSDETLYDPANPPTENVSVSGQFPKTTFTVIPGGIGHISGTVYGLNNLPLQGVQVVVSESRYAAITGEDGTFFIRNVLPGNYTVSCSIYGYENYQTTISLEEDETEQLDIQMIQLPMMVVSGTIQANDSSSGLEGASISLKGYKNYNVLSVADGSFSIPDVYANNSYQFQISKNGYVKQTGTISVSMIDYSMGIIVLNEIAYSPHTLIATLNNPMNRVELSWTAPDPNATGIYQSFEAATFPPQGWSQTITNNGAALANGVHPTWCRVSNISSGSTQVNPTEGSYQAGLWWTYTHQDEWLSTTAFTCPSDAVLSFDSYVFLGSTNDDHYYVKLSLDGGNSWSVIWDASANTGGWNTYSAPIAIDLALYAGMQIRIAFHADDPPANSGLFYHWFIDNVFVGNEHQRLSNTSASRGLVGYKLWRFGVQEQEQPELWTLLTPDPISQNSYYDTSWSEAVEGNYRWAVKAVYAADVTSATAISGTLTKLSDAPSTPENVKIEVSDSNVLISWDPVSTDLMGNPIEVSYYEVHFFTDDFSFVTNPFSLLDITTETSYFLEGITADIDFIFFRIVAVSGVRASFSKDEGLKRFKSAIAKKKAN